MSYPEMQGAGSQCVGHNMTELGVFFSKSMLYSHSKRYCSLAFRLSFWLSVNIGVLQLEVLNLSAEEHDP